MSVWRATSENRGRHNKIATARGQRLKEGSRCIKILKVGRWKQVVYLRLCTWRTDTGVTWWFQTSVFGGYNDRFVFTLYVFCSRSFHFVQLLFLLLPAVKLTSCIKRDRWSTFFLPTALTAGVPGRGTLTLSMEGSEFEIVSWSWSNVNILKWLFVHFEPHTDPLHWHYSHILSVPWSCSF